MKNTSSWDFRYNHNSFSEIIHFQPFAPVGKRTEATVENINGDRFKVTKGATQVILALSSNVD